MQTGVNRKHGLDRGAMGSTQAFAHSRATFGSALARCASGAERNSLGFAHRCSLARFARPLPALSNLPSPFSAVAARRHADATVARAGRRPAGAWQTRSVSRFVNKLCQSLARMTESDRQVLMSLARYPIRLPHCCSRHDLRGQVASHHRKEADKAESQVRVPFFPSLRRMGRYGHSRPERYRSESIQFVLQLLPERVFSAL